MAATHMFLQALVVALTASSASAFSLRSLKVLGKGMGLMTQSVAVAAPVSLQPLYPQNVIMAPVYTTPLMYQQPMGALFPGPAAPIAPIAPAAIAPAQGFINPIIDHLTKAIDRIGGASSSDASDDSAADDNVPGPTRSSYTRVFGAAKPRPAPSPPTLSISLVHPAAGGAAGSPLSGVLSTVADAAGAAPPAPGAGGPAAAGPSATITVPAINLSVPDKKHIIQNTMKTVSDAWSATNDDVRSAADAAREKLRDALQKLKKAPVPAAATAAVPAAAAPVQIVQPVPATTVVPVVSTATVLPTYYTHKAPGKGFFGK